MCSCRAVRVARYLSATVATVVMAIATAGSAAAQTSAGPNSGALTFTGGLDVPSVYFFRGIRQEGDPKLTLFPYGDIGIAVSSKATINFGVWDSLQTGSTGTDGPSGRLHYEEDFYATLNLGLGGGVGLGTTFTAYTSPNAIFTTAKEISFKISKAHRLAPYGIVALEIGGDGSGQADNGAKKGTYIELGVGPSWPLGGGKRTLAIPVKIGLSAKDYYEANGKDHKFGFFDVGAVVTLPLTGVPSQFGTWNVHAGGDILVLGADRAFNVNSDGDAKRNQFIVLFGIGVGY